MIRLLLVALVLIAGFNMPAFAQNARELLDIGNLPDSVKADIMEKANRAKEAEIRKGQGRDAPRVVDPTEISKKTREEMEAWGVLGAGAGKAVVSAAKEVGMAASEFAQTGLGRLIIVLVVIKFLGKSLLAIGFGVVVMLVGYRWGYKLLRPVDDIKYEHVPVLFGAFQWKRTVSANYAKPTEGGVACGILMIAVATLISGLAFFVF